MFQKLKTKVEKKMNEKINVIGEMVQENIY